LLADDATQGNEGPRTFALRPLGLGLRGFFTRVHDTQRVPVVVQTGKSKPALVHEPTQEFAPFGGERLGTSFKDAGRRQVGELGGEPCKVGFT